MDENKTRIALSIGGMHCAVCAGHVEKALKALPGVREAGVSLPLEQALIAYDPAAVAPQALIDAVRAAGYEVRDAPSEGVADRAAERLGVDGDAKDALRRMLLAWGGAALSMLPMLFEEAGRHSPTRHDALTIQASGPFGGWWIFFWAALAGVGAGMPVIRRAARQALARKAGMDALISLGVTASLGSGLAARFDCGPADFSMIGGMIMAFHLTGRWLEARARRRAARDFAALAALGAKTAILERDGAVLPVPASSLVPGDIVRVPAGEKIPGDGVVIEGAAGVDEALLTGESVPAAKREGDEVVGGSLNVDGFLRVRVVRPAAEAFLARIARMAAEAQGGKPPIQVLADRVTGAFVPTVLVLAACAAGVQYWLGDAAVFAGLRSALAGALPWIDAGASAGERALSAGVATLLIACPCALGLAAPMALTVGLGAAARRGVLFRDGSSVQSLAGTDVVMLDKTGTVTSGRPAVFACDGPFPASCGEWTEPPPERDGEGARTPPPARLLAVAQALEEKSTHPAARAVASYAGQTLSGPGGGIGRGPEALASKPKRPRPSVENWKSEAGRGVSARVDGKMWRIGSLSWAAEHGVPIPPALASRGGAPETSGLAPAALFDDARVWLVFWIGDVLRDEAASVLRGLRSGGKRRRRRKGGRRLILATGDRRESAERAARALGGVDEIAAALRPEDKLARIRVLQGAGNRVAMVGDGANDAPALAAADVGVAIGAGADAAREAGDVLLVREGLDALADAFLMAEAIMSTMRQNLFWAFFYNVLALPLAFSGVLHPLAAEAAMAASSLTVAGNALRLRRLAIGR